VKAAKYLRKIYNGMNTSIISLISAQNPGMNFYLSICLWCSPEDFKIIFSNRQTTLEERVQLGSVDSRKARSQAQHQASNVVLKGAWRGSTEVVVKTLRNIKPSMQLQHKHDFHFLSFFLIPLH